MSEVMENPAAVQRNANHRPVAVCTRDRVAFYMIEPRLFDALLDDIADQELHLPVARRLTETSRAIAVDIGGLQESSEGYRSRRFVPEARRAWHYLASSVQAKFEKLRATRLVNL